MDFVASSSGDSNGQATSGLRLGAEFRLAPATLPESIMWHSRSCRAEWAKKCQLIWISRGSGPSGCLSVVVFVCSKSPCRFGPLASPFQLRNPIVTHERSINRANGKCRLQECPVPLHSNPILHAKFVAVLRRMPPPLFRHLAPCVRVIKPEQAAGRRLGMGAGQSHYWRHRAWGPSACRPQCLTVL